MDFDDPGEAPRKIFRAKKAINKKTKVHVVFNEKARRDYLTGFSKRKSERKKKAQEEFQVLLKEEKKRIKQEARESYKKLTKTFEPIPEVEHLQTEEYDLGTHSVCITELSTDEIAKHNHWIGANKPLPIKEEEEDEEDIAEKKNPNEIEGMSLGDEKKKSDGDSEDKKPENQPLGTLKKQISKNAAELLKNSKVFKLKQIMERSINKRKARSLKNKKKKFLKKHQKGYGKNLKKKKKR